MAPAAPATGHHVSPCEKSRPQQLGRPRVAEEAEQFVIRMAEENATRGYRRLQGALANLSIIAQWIARQGAGNGWPVNTARIVRLSFLTTRDHSPQQLWLLAGDASDKLLLDRIAISGSR
jgi:hypothetical protein